VIALPPSEDGAVQFKTIVPIPEAATGVPGAVAVVRGIVEVGVDSTVVPIVLLACTVNEYEVPFVKLLTLQEVDADEQDWVEPVTV
jgi:hypothetical protein